MMAAAAAVVWATVEAAKVEKVKSSGGGGTPGGGGGPGEGEGGGDGSGDGESKWAVVEEAAEVIWAVKKELVEMVGEWVEK